MKGSFPGCAIGAFVNGTENIPSFQTMIGRKLAVVLFYVHWQEPFPLAEAETVSSNGSIPLITWEPWVTQPQGTLEAIVSGSYENYVRDFMQAAKDWGKPLFLRFAHEMNGNWYPWDGDHNGGAAGAGAYKRAWIYIYNVRRELGATNVDLVWCPNNIDLPGESWNVLEAYYPGDRYVDWVGMDGYNWGYGGWQDFNSVFNGVYNRLIKLTQKPLLIGEFATAEQGGNKAEWITAACLQIKNKYSRVKVFCWFNIDKERDWRVDSSGSAAAAMRNSLQDGYFLDKIDIPT
ncbi:MAG: glycosyl hydrolase [Candidatus Margulisbacteria bacterium]|nr:glycosyl hydrolase [Candidatus Margulisiibacteriota bacterium]